MVYARGEFVAVDEYLCDRGCDNNRGDLAGAKVSVGGVLDCDCGDRSAGASSGMAGIYCWQRDAVLGLQ